MNEAQQIVEEVNEQEVTVGELLTVVAMYPAHYSDPYLQSLREALRLIEKQGSPPNRKDCPHPQQCEDHSCTGACVPGSDF